MTIVVWDGTTLAVDRGVTDGFTMWEQDKAWKLDDIVITGSGHMASVIAMRDWYMNGSNPDTFPNKLVMGDNYSELIVVSRAGLIRFEKTYIPFEHGHNKCAFGSGKDFAYGALAMGATAEQAVSIANHFSIHCGMGVDVYSFKEDTHEQTNKSMGSHH